MKTCRQTDVCKKGLIQDMVDMEGFSKSGGELNSISGAVLEESS
ncbi:hypothetical protein SP21_25 [Salmonella phage 21]|nr:hypothetical protein SP21_25 [Salmonella phage 21]